MPSRPDPGGSSLKSRLPRIMPVVALMVIAATIPFALRDTLETGRVYLFSRQFLDELPQRFSGAGRLRFILQPLIAIVLGWRSGLADARVGNPPFLFGLLFAHGRRRELLRSAASTVSTLLAMGIILDLVFQIILYRSVHPGAALVVGPILIGAPYAVSRAWSNRLARAFRVNQPTSP